MNYNIFLDTDNISSADCSYVSRLGPNCNVYMFTSEFKKKFDVVVMQGIIDSDADFQIIPVSTVGKNSMDFVITSYAAMIATAHPDEAVHIVSNDQDFIHVCSMSKAVGRTQMADIKQNRTLKEFLLVEAEGLSEIISFDDYQFLAK